MKRLSLIENKLKSKMTRKKAMRSKGNCNEAVMALRAIIHRTMRVAFCNAKWPCQNVFWHGNYWRFAQMWQSHHCLAKMYFCIKYIFAQPPLFCIFFVKCKSNLKFKFCYFRPTRTRTVDHRLVRAPLYQLSYEPILLLLNCTLFLLKKQF